MPLSPLMAINDGQFVPKEFLMVFGIGTALKGLTYFYYKDSGVLNFNLSDKTCLIT